MTSDLDLLEKFVRENSQDAFGEIVQRHLNLVYSAALRQVRSRQLAEEIAQSVFADLAQNAGKICSAGVSPASLLTPWLYTVTRRTAIDVIRKESRRQLREQIAVERNTMNATESSAGASPAWSEIEKFLDDAMESLDETDRSAVLLRYFENKSLREVGEALGASEDAAQKRVSRAVERLREFFSKRKVTAGASGLVVLISANAVQSAPVGLAVTISAAALAGAAVSTSAAVAVIKTFAMTTLERTIIGATLVAAVGTGVFEAHQASQLRDQIQTLQQQQAPLAEQIRQLQQERDDATKQLKALLAENAQLKSNSNENELLRLRGEVGILKSKNENENLRLRQKISQLEGMWANWTNGVHFTNPFFSRDEWSESGTDEPINALQTMLWAIKQKNDTKLAELVCSTNTIESLILPKRVWDKVTGVQVVNETISNGGEHRTAIIGTILEKGMGDSGTSPDTSSKNPVLDRYFQTENVMRTWFLVESNGQWLITAGG